MSGLVLDGHPHLARADDGSYYEGLVPPCELCLPRGEGGARNADHLNDGQPVKAEAA